MSKKAQKILHKLFFKTCFSAWTKSRQKQIPFFLQPAIPPNLLDLIPPPPTYPPSPPLLKQRKQLSSSSQFGLQGGGTVASEATEETSRLLMTDECDGSSLNRENGYAKLKKNKNKVKA